jgi:hypothetical protein
LPRILTFAGRSVIALASRSDLKDRPFMLSRNSAGAPLINSVLIRFFSSSSFAPAVMALGWRPYAMMKCTEQATPSRCRNRKPLLLGAASRARGKGYVGGRTLGSRGMRPDFGLQDLAQRVRKSIQLSELQ